MAISNNGMFHYNQYLAAFWDATQCASRLQMMISWNDAHDCWRNFNVKDETRNALHNHRRINNRSKRSTSSSSNSNPKKKTHLVTRNTKYIIDTKTSKLVSNFLCVWPFFLCFFFFGSSYIINSSWAHNNIYGSIIILW